MNSGIRATRFQHLQTYDYRTHTAKIEQLCQGGFSSLATLLTTLHQNCPEHPFETGPRASKQRHVLYTEMLLDSRHERCRNASIGLRVNSAKYSTAHSQVECYMLEHDQTTVAVEVPVWTSAERLANIPVPIRDKEFLSGHIDLLAVEGNSICIWDYKPDAKHEQYASVQVALYALMLSHMTSIPLHQFRCGYFDATHVIEFTPNQNDLEQMTMVSVADQPGSVHINPSASRVPGPTANLKALGIKSPHPAMSASSVMTWHLFSTQKKTVRETAELRQMSLQNVYEDLEEAIRCGALSITELVPSDRLAAIAFVWDQLADDQWTPMKSLSEKLQGEFPHGVLRCAIAGLRRPLRHWPK
ncbi:MAG: helix-turn-helix domain-containing protein [Planctomyces sp.]|nr:helix-turn-helix domain-containing protein [Planctomyces sp.]